MAPRVPLFSVTTPIPGVLREVTLYEHTWLDHVVGPHPEVAGLLAKVQATVEYPTVILDSFSVTGNYLFINQEVQDDQMRSLRVPVKPLGTGLGVVVSAYFSGNVSNAGALLWHRFMGGGSDR